MSANDLNDINRALGVLQGQMEGINTRLDGMDRRLEHIERAVVSMKIKVATYGGAAGVVGALGTILVKFLVG